MKVRLFLLTACMFVAGLAGAQKVAIKNNLLYDATLTPNIGLEIGLAKKWTLDTEFGANCFLYETKPSSDKYKNTKWSHWALQPELRYWTCERFNGLFVGLHGHGGQLNFGGLDVPFVLNRDTDMKSSRYQGYFYGGGISLGYQWILSNRFNLEASLGGGYARIHYDKFKAINCGPYLGEGVMNYVGPTKATLSLLFFFK